MMKKAEWILVVVAILVAVTVLVMSITGCTMTSDDETGERQYGVKPVVGETIETGGKLLETLGPPVVTGITAVNAVAGGVAGVVLTAVLSLLSCYRKWKVPLVEKSGMLVKVTAGLRAAGDVIENVVKPSKELWDKAKPVLKTAAANGAVNADKLKKVM
ncbi:MAG TPA: hypothetical protein ENH94_06985 [Phycisphaerales bacterium]|nr:hypothetical protein [Phycisphaerales bacterium]